MRGENFTSVEAVAITCSRRFLIHRSPRWQENPTFRPPDVMVALVGEPINLLEERGIAVLVFCA